MGSGGSSVRMLGWVVGGGPIVEGWLFYFRENIFCIFKKFVFLENVFQTFDQPNVGKLENQTHSKCQLPLKHKLLNKLFRYEP